MSSRLAVSLGRLSLRNPVLVASGTFGYAREMASFLDFSNLGGVIPKTVTLAPRPGNPPPRTIETASGMLNAIGLDNDGLETFLSKHLDHLAGLDTALIVNVAGRDAGEYVELARRLDFCDGVAAVELNISCPNVSGGVDYGSNPAKTAEVVGGVREACGLPVIAKLTPNVTDITEIAKAAADAGADAVSVVNTFLGLVIDWRRRAPVLGNGLGGLSGPAIKPLALRCVWQIANSVDVPVIGIGGIESVDDVMDYLVAGATAVQVGTANYYKPGLSGGLAAEIEGCLDELGAGSVTDVIGTLGPSKVAAAACAS
ncbi:MAG: dihydroorotate dehydrogenase [Planctomycetota bacterium]